MNITSIIQQAVSEGLKALYDIDMQPGQWVMNVTKKEFEGDYTVVTFPFAKAARKRPDAIGEELGRYVLDNVGEIRAFNVIKGFLNLSVEDGYWKGFLEDLLGRAHYGEAAPNGEKALVEFSSPNTNKPLHLGHIRNILLGWSSSKILAAAGCQVDKVQIINDRGIAICKSMLAWQKFGNGGTPEGAGVKGDHYVGYWYVEFEKHFQAEYQGWQQTSAAAELLESKGVAEENMAAFFKKYKNEYFNRYSGLGGEAKEMLRKWEAGDGAVRALWQKMNGWVYEGFDTTYKRLGVSFDRLYYESNTYLLGKDLIMDNLEKGVFYQKGDGSIWIDLEDEGLDHKLVLRNDGTSVYMTQDIGTARLRFENHGAERMVYVVADEQNYHFSALFAILKKMGEPYAAGCHHLSYGMVNLTTGRMKSREGTIVDADNLLADVIAEARKNTEEFGTIADLPQERQDEIIRQIGVAALKFFIIKVHPKKTMVFDSSASVEIQGQTGPYIQYAAVRVKSAVRKAGTQYRPETAADYGAIQEAEKEVLLLLHQYPGIVKDAAKDYDPSSIANFCYELARAYNHFWASGLSMLSAESEAAGAFRLKMSRATLQVLTHGLDLIGIEVPERM